MNQDHLAKSLLQLVLILWPSPDHQGLLDLQVLLEPMVCRVPLALLVSQDNLDLRESEERKEKRETKENLVSLVVSQIQKLSVPPEPRDFHQWVD